MLAAWAAAPNAAPAFSNSAAEIPLSQMAGKWQGDGWGMRNPTAARENIRCRMKARYRRGSNKISISGKCAAISRTFTLLGHIAQTPNSNRMTGRWVNPDGFGSMNITGYRTGNRLTFEYSAKDKKSGQTKKYRTVWALSEEGFVLGTQTVDGGIRDIGSISFRR